jgi:hypothetical protein
MVIGGGGLLCASAAVLCGLVIPAALLALLTALVALVRAVTGSRFRPGLAVAAAVAGAGVVGAAWLSPGLLGPTYRASRDRDPVDSQAARAVPRSGHKPAADLAEGDWADASRAAVQQGSVRVEVIDAAVGPAKTRAGPQKCLRVRVRVHQVEGASDFAERRRERPAFGDDRARPTVTDDAGKVYEPRQAGAAAPAEDVRKSSRFPVTVMEEEFLFEAPAAAPRPLRLEVPASAWGGSGVFRFTIPATMIRRDSTAGPRPGR